MPPGLLPDRRVLWLGVLAVVCTGATLWALSRGTAHVRVFLLGSLAASIWGGTLLRWRRGMAGSERIAAVPLGLVGVAGFVVGTPTDLPVLFVLLSVGSLVDLCWDPTGTVYGG